MAMILRVIPNSLYEKLEENNFLEKEFSSNEADHIGSLLKEIPSTLKQKARAILECILQDHSFGWNTETLEVTNGSETIEGSDISKLIHSLVLQSQKFLYLKGADRFAELLMKSRVPTHLFQIPSYTPQVSTPIKETRNKSNWVHFEDKYTLDG